MPKGPKLQQRKKTNIRKPETRTRVIPGLVQPLVPKIGASPTADTPNQSSVLQSHGLPSQNNGTLATGNNTQTATIIERLLERGVNISEIHAD